MQDALGTYINVGDVVLFPGGNARYGGLKMMVGVVQKMTAKRVSLKVDTLPSEGKDAKTTAKTGAKIMVVKDPAVVNHPHVKALKGAT